MKADGIANPKRDLERINRNIGMCLSMFFTQIDETTQVNNLLETEQDIGL